MTCNNKTFDVYIAIPYTHEDPAVRQKRYHMATEYLALLTGDGLVAFSPITHSHPLHFYEVPTDWDFWGRVDLRIIKGCEELHVITEPGWNVSKGVTAEIVEAQKLGMPIKYIDPNNFREGSNGN